MFQVIWEVSKIVYLYKDLDNLSKNIFNVWFIFYSIYV